MNAFDFNIIHFLNSFAGRSREIDAILVLMGTNVLLRGGLIVVLFWWAWAQTDEKGNEERELLLFSLVASAFAVVLARILALTLPYRARPMHNPLLNFELPYSMDPSALIGWSSFPSDHAVVFFCLAMGLWFVSKRLGTLALIYAALGTSLPRIYLGIHYPTDVLAGAALGIGIACLVKVDWIRDPVMRPVMYWQEHHPGSFAAFLFLCSFETAEEYNSMRLVALSGFHGVRKVLLALR